MREEEIRNKSLSAVRWGLIGTVAEFLMQFAVQVCMARILGPEIYGLFALGLLVLGLCTLLNQGWSWGIVQAREINPEQAQVVFTWQVLSGLALALTLAGSAGLIADWFNEARAAPVLHALALVVFMGALASTPINLAKRQLDFRYLHLTRLVAFGIAYLVVGLPLALAGLGVKAPLSAMLMHGFLVMAFAWWRTRGQLRLRLTHPGAKTLADFGFTAIATNACNWLINSTDRLVLGRLLNATSLGIYSVGSNLATVPANVLLNALQPAFLSTAARMQDDLPRMRRAYLGALATIWIVLAPLFILLAVLAPEMVMLLYGPRWEAAGIVLQVLALAMPAYISWGMSTPVLWSTGKKHYEMLLQLPLLPLAALAYVLAAPHGMPALAAAAAAVAGVRALIFVVAACLRLHASRHELLPMISRGALSTTLAATASVWLEHLLRAQEVPPLFVIAGVGAIVLPLLALLAWRFPFLIGPQAGDVLARLMPRRRGGQTVTP